MSEWLSDVVDGRIRVSEFPSVAGPGRAALGCQVAELGEAYWRRLEDN